MDRFIKAFLLTIAVLFAVVSMLCAFVLGSLIAKAFPPFLLLIPVVVVFAIFWDTTT